MSAVHEAGGQKRGLVLATVPLGLRRRDGDMK